MAIIILEIKCIFKPNRQNRNERILAVGGSQNGTRWQFTEDQAIAAIESGTHQFWTMGGGQRTEVIVASNNGRKYLKTKADTTTKDNLLSLPECPKS